MVFFVCLFLYCASDFFVCKYHFCVVYAKGNFWNDNMTSKQTKMIVRLENQAWKCVGTKAAALPGRTVLKRVECMSSYHFQSVSLC